MPGAATTTRVCAAVILAIAATAFLTQTSVASQGGRRDKTPPSAPTGLSLSAATQTSLSLSWTASSDNVAVSGYGVYSNGVLAGSPASTGYTLSGLACGTSYSIAVDAFDAAGNRSAKATVTTSTSVCPDTQPPSAPISLAASLVTQTSLTVGWSASSDNVGVSGYVVYKNGSQLGQTASTSYAIAGLACSSAYTFSVEARDAAGNVSTRPSLAVSTSGCSGPPAPAGLVAAYSFDEGSGSTVADASSKGNHGTVANGAWAAGKYGSALSFNGTDARVTIPDAASLHLTNAMTLEAWVKPSSVTSVWRDVIFKGDDNYYLEGTSDNGGKPGAGGTFGKTYGSALAANTWTHLAVTYDQSTIRLYANGVEVSSVASSMPIAGSANPLQIGGDAIYGQYFAGLIDDVRVYGTVLSQSQIQSDMTTPITPPAPDPQAPTAPSALSASAVTQTGVTLNWSASSDNIGVTGYTAYVNGSQVGQTASTSYTLSGLACGTGYVFAVEARDAAGNVSPRPAISASTSACTAPPSPSSSPSSFINYSCAHSWYVNGALTSGSNNGTSWADAWRAFGNISWGSVVGGDCLYISGGSTSQTYTTPLTVGASGSSNSSRIMILSGQDAGHNGVVILSGVSLILNNRSYVTVDGEGSDGSTQHIRVLNASIQTQSNTNPILRYVEGDNSPVTAVYGAGGDFDHLYLHNINSDSAINFTARDTGGAYDKVILEYSHIMVNSMTSESGSGSDGVQGCYGCTVRYSVLESYANGNANTSQHQDLIQSEGSWFSAYGNVFKDGGDSAFDYDCWTGSAANHIRIFNNVFIKSRGGSAIRFYASGGTTCKSFDNIHIDNNTFVDHTCCVSSYGVISFNNFNGNPTVTSSEIQNNIFYDNTVSQSIHIDASSGFTAADWKVDYNNVSGGSWGVVVGGSNYSQQHGLTCTPVFSGYVKDSSPYSTASLVSDLHLAPNDTCAASAGTALSSLFAMDKDGIARPQSGAWDIGAYQRVTGS